MSEQYWILSWISVCQQLEKMFISMNFSHPSSEIVNWHDSYMGVLDIREIQ